MESLEERITYVLEHYDGTQAGLANEIGITKSAVGQWKKGYIKNIRPENLFPLAKATGFSAEWIGTGKGEIYNSSSISDEEVRLLKFYRDAPNKLKKAIMEVAEIVSEDQYTNDNNEVKSSENN